MEKEKDASVIIAANVFRLVFNAVLSVAGVCLTAWIFGQDFWLLLAIHAVCSSALFNQGIYNECIENIRAAWETRDK